MKNTKIVSIIFSIFIMVFVGFLSLTASKVNGDTLGGTTGVQVSGGKEGDPCANNEGSSDSSSFEDCGGGGGGPTRPTLPSPIVRPEPPVTRSSNSSDSVVVFVEIENTTSMTGVLTPHSKSCGIAVGSNFCNISFDWEVKNPVAVSSVTRNPDSQFIVEFGDKRENVSLPVKYGNNGFFLYNNKVKLDEEFVTASCKDSIWDSANNKCVTSDTVDKDFTPRISLWAGYANQHTEEGVWTTDPEGIAFAVVAPDLNTEAYRVEYCKKFYGSSIKSSPAYKMEEIKTWMTRHNESGPYTSTQQSYKCSKDTGEISSPSATLSAEDCLIKNGESSCNAKISWLTLGYTGDTSVTTPVGITVGTGLSGSKTYPVSYGNPRDFFLYNNGTLLAERKAKATCASNKWDPINKKCVDAGTIIEGETPSATLSAEDCFIKTNENSCKVKLFWVSKNIIGNFAITTPENITVSSSPEGQGLPYETGYGIRNFFAYNNGNLLSQVEARADCSSSDSWNVLNKKCESKNPGEGGEGGDGDPFWGAPWCGECNIVTGKQNCFRECDHAPSTGKYCDGDFDRDGIWSYVQSCGGPAGGGSGTSLLNIILTVTPDKIFKGKTAILSWSSTAQKCVATQGDFVTGGASSAEVEIKPIKTTTYEIECSKGEITEKASATIKVNNISIIES